MPLPLDDSCGVAAVSGLERATEVLSVFSFPVSFPERGNDQQQVHCLCRHSCSAGAVSRLGVDLSRELLALLAPTPVHSPICLHHH